MEIPITVEEVEALEGLPPSGVDLNTADSAELKSISGIGPALAARIIAYREARGPFLAVEELLAVSGVGEKIYVRIADQVTLSFPPPTAFAADAEAPLPDTDAAPVEAETWPPPLAEDDGFLYGEPPLPPDEDLTFAEFSVVDEALAQAEIPFADVGTDAAQAETLQPAAVSTPEIPPPAPVRPLSQPAAPPPPASRPAKSSGWGWVGWLSAVFVGSILGLVFSLLVLNGINGVLDMNYHPAVIELRTQTADLTARMDSLQGDVTGLRQRLDRLEGLTARMERAEAAVEMLRGDVEALGEETAALQAATDALTQELADVAARTAKAETFFQRLQALLAELFGGAAESLPAPGE